MILIKADDKMLYFWDIHRVVCVISGFAEEKFGTGLQWNCIVWFVFKGTALMSWQDCPQTTGCHTQLPENRKRGARYEVMVSLVQQH